jgi:hypothetical protein
MAGIIVGKIGSGMLGSWEFVRPCSYAKDGRTCIAAGRKEGRELRYGRVPCSEKETGGIPKKPFGKERGKCKRDNWRKLSSFRLDRLFDVSHVKIPPSRAAR